MRAFPTWPIILLESRHVSVCLHWKAHSTDAMALAAKEILHKHGWQQAAFIGHSYGTFVMSRIEQLHKSIVQSMVSPPFFSPCRKAQAYLALNIKQIISSNLTQIKGPRANCIHLVCYVHLMVLHLPVAQVWSLAGLVHMPEILCLSLPVCGEESQCGTGLYYSAACRRVPNTTQDKSRADV